MRKAVACCVLGFMLGCFSTVACGAAKKKHIELDIKRAVNYFVPYVVESTLPYRSVYFKHICCDCASTHDVVIEIKEDGVDQHWWKDEKETRRRRMMQGIDSPVDPWGVERR